MRIQPRDSRGSNRWVTRRHFVAAACAAAVCLGMRAIEAADVASALAFASVPPDVRSGLTPDPLAGSAQIDPRTTGPDAERILATMLPPRSDSPADWFAPLEPLHACGEPRVLPPCVPPPPCHPALPPAPYDLVGVAGIPTCGPIYGGPCDPRTGTHDDGRLPRLHRVHDRLFDWFYRPR